MTQRLHKIPRYAIEGSNPHLIIKDTSITYITPYQEQLQAANVKFSIANITPPIPIDIYELILSFAWASCYHQDFVRTCKLFYKIIYSVPFLRSTIFGKKIGYFASGNFNFYIPCLSLLIAGLRVSNLDITYIIGIFLSCDPRTKQIYTTDKVLITDEPPSKYIMMLLIASGRYVITTGMMFGGTDVIDNVNIIKEVARSLELTVDNVDEISQATDLPWRAYSNGINIEVLRVIKTNKVPPPYLHDKLVQTLTSRWISLSTEYLDINLLWTVKPLRTRILQALSVGLMRTTFGNNEPPNKARVIKLAESVVDDESISTYLLLYILPNNEAFIARMAREARAGTLELTKELISWICGHLCSDYQLSDATDAKKDNVSNIIKTFTLTKLQTIIEHEIHLSSCIAYATTVEELLYWLPSNGRNTYSRNTALDGLVNHPLLREPGKRLDVDQYFNDTKARSFYALLVKFHVGEKAKLDINRVLDISKGIVVAAAITKIYMELCGENKHRISIFNPLLEKQEVLVAMIREMRSCPADKPRYNKPNPVSAARWELFLHSLRTTSARNNVNVTQLTDVTNCEHCKEEINKVFKG